MIYMLEIILDSKIIIICKTITILIYIIFILVYFQIDMLLFFQYFFYLLLLYLWLHQFIYYIRNKKLGTDGDILSSLNIFSIIFSIIFCGFLAYIIYKYINIVKTNKLENSKNIKADIFLEELLSEIAGRHPKNIFIFILIILFPSAMLIFMVAIIYGFLLIKLYNLNFKNVEEHDVMEYNIETNINEE